MPEKPDLQAIRERAEKATEGPWERFNYIGHLGGLRRVRTSRGVEGPLVECKEPVKQLIAEFQSSDDAAFASHARQDIPDLLDALARVTLENERLTKELAERAVCTVDICPKCGADFNELQTTTDGVLLPYSKWNELRKKLAERDEAVGLLREILPWRENDRTTDAEIRASAFLSRLDQPQEKSNG